MKIIDQDSWPRKSHYDFFKTLPNPHISITVNVPITNLVQNLAPAGVSRFNAALYGLMTAVNGVPELRTRFRENNVVVEHETIHASTTVPIENNRFAFCNIQYSKNWPEFDERCREAVETAKKQEELKENIERGDEWVYLSCLPWFSFTGITNCNNGPGDCIPRISWGKFENNGSEWTMPVNIQVHHALVDGAHIGAFFELVETTIAKMHN